MGARRASWRILQSVEQSEVAKGNEKRVKLIQKYRTVVEKELDEICGEILELLDKHLIPSASTCEASVFYLKMKADYLRYLSEFKTDADRKDAADKTLMAYNAAQDKALAELPSTNPIRLGLALNFSVFYYEVMNQPEKACNLAKQVRWGPAWEGVGGRGFHKAGSSSRETMVCAVYAHKQRGREVGKSTTWLCASTC